MNISGRANVRTTEAARQGLAQGLSVSFKAGAVTGLLVAGLALLAVSVYYMTLLGMGATGRGLVDPLVALGFGASLISIFARLGGGIRSEEHTSELQSLMRISYAVFCLKKKQISTNKQYLSHSTSTLILK